MTEVMAKIKESELRKLQRAQDKLAALEAGGVDNWEWYDESLREYNKEQAEEDLVDDLVSRLDDYLCDTEVDFPAGYEAGPNVTIPYSSAESFIKLVISMYKELE